MPAMKTWSAVAFSLLALVACDKGKSGGGGSSGVAEKDGADGLKAVFAASQTACTKKDFKTGKSIVMSLLPQKEQLKKIFKDDVPDAKLDEITAQYKEVPPDDEKVACLLSPPGRTDIKVHASSVEDLVAYKEGTPAFEEFPGGAKRLAETVLKPAQTFYEVEVTEPGKDSGTKFHMFFWDGAHWRMLGPAWRTFN